MLQQVGIKWERNKSIEVALHTLKHTLDNINNNNNNKKSKQQKSATTEEEETIDFGALLDQFTSSSSHNNNNNNNSNEFDELKEILSKHSSLLTERKLTNHQLSPPEKLDLVGSFLLRSIAKPNQHVDVSLTIPSKLLKKGDVSNHKYYAIRAAYLLLIAKYLSTVHMFSNIEVQAFKNDCLKPLLVITPQKGTFIFVGCDWILCNFLLLYDCI